MVGPGPFVSELFFSVSRSSLCPVEFGGRDSFTDGRCSCGCPVLGHFGPIGIGALYYALEVRHATINPTLSDWVSSGL